MPEKGHWTADHALGIEHCQQGESPFCVWSERGWEEAVSEDGLSDDSEDATTRRS